MSSGEISNIIEQHLIANVLNNPLNNPKFWKGEKAREKWAKPISSDHALYIDDYNNKCGIDPVISLNFFMQIDS